VGHVPHRRLFFALWPEPPLRARIVAATARAVEAAGGRVVPAVDLHVTLAFLGNVPGPRYADAVAAAHAIRGTAGAQSFDRIASWGRGGPLVLEASSLDPALGALRTALADALAAADFVLDRRPFRPHITLSRRPHRRPPPTPPETASATLESPYSRFVLVESQTEPEGSRYTVREAFRLGAAHEASGSSGRGEAHDAG
jgi:2'-5' RNA ligase